MKFTTHHFAPKDELLIKQVAVSLQVTPMDYVTHAVVMYTQSVLKQLESQKEAVEEKAPAEEPKPEGE